MAPVKLYIYDLSRGMAAQLSRQLTGSHIEGIWHTSIVFHGREWFYGPGILSASPGMSHHGQPLKIVDLGESEIDEDTFREYIDEMRSIYTADKYHLLEFNCNSFTNDVAGFLTGGSIPAYIKDLPSNFLNTPFGQMLRPTIDQMFRGPTTARPIPSRATPSQATSLLQDVASRTATNGTPIQASVSTSTLTAPIQICTNPSSFKVILERHKAVVVFFTSQTCPPCKMIEPIFEELAHAKASPQVAFVRVDMGVGMGGMVAHGFEVRATPTFVFFLNGKKTYELKGANAPELRSQVNLLLYDAFPQHPHAKLNLPALRNVSLNPILFTQQPKFDALGSKLYGTVNELSSVPNFQHQQQLVIARHMVAYVQAAHGLSKPNASTATITKSISEWTNMTMKIVEHAPQTALFPLVDLWRLAVLVPEVAATLSSPNLSKSSPIPPLLKIAADSLALPEAKNTVLTTLRLSCNIFANPSLTRTMLSTQGSRGSHSRDALTSLLVPALLADVSNIRVAAASLAFNIAAILQAPLMESFQNGKKGAEEPVKDEAVDDLDWEVELLSAVVEGIAREDSEDGLHRLVTCLGLLIHLSPHLEEIRSLLEVLQVKETLQSKLDQKGLITKDSIQKLVMEIADQLC